MAGLDPRLMDTAAIETFTHLLANNVAFLPYQQVVDLGGTLRSIAIAGFADRETLLAELRNSCRGWLCRFLSALATACGCTRLWDQRLWPGLAISSCPC